MQTTRKPTLNWLLTGGLLLGLAAASQAAITTIADSFTLNGTTRTAGAALGGLTTEVGGATWTTVGSAFYFDADGTVAGTTASWTAPQASVALPAVTGLVTLTADAKLSNASDGGQWCAIGFMANDSANWFTDSRQLSAYVKYDGSWSLMTGNGTAIASGDFGTPLCLVPRL
jgi:hypothetical protein